MSVYTSITQSQLEVFLRDYDIGALETFVGISEGIENTNYFVTTTQATWVLTIFEQHTADELDYFLSLMDFLAENGVSTARPVRQKNKMMLGMLAGKPAAVVEKLSGRGIDGVPTLAQCQQIGQTLARMHLVGERFVHTRNNDRDVDWLDATAAQVFDQLDTSSQVLINKTLAYVKTLPADLPKSTIHADLFRDNALFEGEDLGGIIDLYYACYAECVYDLSVLINDWCVDGDGLDATRARAIMSSYQTERALSPAEKSAFAGMFQKAALRFYLSRSKDKHFPREGEMTQIKNPDAFKLILLWHRAHPDFSSRIL